MSFSNGPSVTLWCPSTNDQPSHCDVLSLRTKRHTMMSCPLYLTLQGPYKPLNSHEVEQVMMTSHIFLPLIADVSMQPKLRSEDCWFFNDKNFYGSRLELQVIPKRINREERTCLAMTRWRSRTSLQLLQRQFRNGQVHLCPENIFFRRSRWTPTKSVTASPSFHPWSDFKIYLSAMNLIHEWYIEHISVAVRASLSQNFRRFESEDKILRKAWLEKRHQNHGSVFQNG